ncbi:MarR family winged helix-turn-helix transcriptional regulator [Streptomyces sp. NPDC058382]|uniref:MarR family winged helix-turn-helix transcriptional regulator n=1 Tax=unclassified Streptomyces TaxID=2593676 RepID=UPI003644C403
MTTDSEASGLADDGPQNTVDALVQLSFLIHRIVTAAGAEHDLSVIQIRLLGILRDRRAGMVELGRHLGLDKSSMTGLVGRAEKRGLVERAPSPYDGRAVLVTLTPDGRQLAERCTDEIGRRVTALTGELSAGQRARLTELAASLVSARRGVSGQAV